MLTRELRVHLLNASVSGCLVESNLRIEVGTVGTIRVELDGEEYEDEVQVLRCQEIAGAGSVYHLGMQFLWTRRRTNDRFATRLRAAWERSRSRKQPV